MRNRVLVVGAFAAAAGAAALLLYRSRGSAARRPLTVQLSSLLGQRRQVQARAAKEGAPQGHLFVSPKDYPAVSSPVPSLWYMNVSSTVTEALAQCIRTHLLTVGHSPFAGAAR